MSSLIFGIIVSALLSTTSLLAVLFRVSPIAAPMQALPALFVSVFLSASSIGTLFFFVIWRWIPIHSWDIGKLLGISIREGIFLGLGTVFALTFLLLGLLTWWIMILIFTVFVLIELALTS